MGTTLTGTTPQDTYDSLIKVTDNGPISGTLKALSDGLGNDSTLSLSTTAASIAGTLAVTGNATFDTDTLFVDAANNRVGIGIITPDSKVRIQNDNATVPSLTIRDGGTPTVDHIRVSSGTYGDAFFVGATGNVGIGTSSPDTLVTLGTTARTDNTAGIKIFRGGGTASFVTYGFSGNAVINSVGGDLVIQRESSERARFTTAGLCFNGDFAAANALDDYEEGTWTMGVAFGGASVGVTYINNAGRYTKIGRQVTASGYLALSSKGSSTGDAEITGLPFTNVGIAAGIVPVTLRYDSVSFTNTFQGFLNAGETKVLLGEITVLGTATNLTNADFQNGSSIMVSVTYTV
jgi:hypothetical protein